MPLYLPDIYEEESSRSMTANFLGLNRNLRIADGEGYDMSNLSGDHAPVMEVRKRRGIPKIAGTYKPNSIITRAVGGAGTYHPVWLDGPTLFEGKDEELVRIDLGALGLDPNAEHQLVNMGVYLIIHPEMIYVNMIDHQDRGVIMDRVSIEGTWSVTVVDYEGALPEFAQATEPVGTEEEPLVNGMLWHKTGANAGLYRYDDAVGEWYTVPPYPKIEVKDAEENPISISLKSPLKAGDSVRISGPGGFVNKTSLVTRIEEYPEQEGTTAYIQIDGILNGGDLEMVGEVTIERVIPKMDFICEANNRLWGCRYGEDASGNFVNEIYCSARGDFYRWIAGSSDNIDAPVTFSVGSDGAWTGAINYDGYPTFFKERIMYRVSGYGASSFSLYDTNCMGVARGAHRSIAVVKNMLYYKAASAIMGFDGSLPVPVSEALGRLQGYTGAVGAACGAKYYISLWKASDKTDKHMYVLDTDKGVWHKEDEAVCESMAAAGDNMYFIQLEEQPGGTVRHVIKTVEPMDGMGEDEIESKRIAWFAETGLIGLETPDAKYLTKIAIRLKMDAGSTVRVSVQYDSMGAGKQIGAVEASYMKSATVPITPSRCDHMRLRLDGIGGCQVYSITKTFERAEDR